jgi:para-aminobenzoate synthetase
MQGRILFVDAYDSFSNNIIAELERIATVEVVKHDDSRFAKREALLEYLQYFDAVVAGPGPGHPANNDDVGIIKELWDLDIPVLGICLGFQSLCLHFGATVSTFASDKAN